MFRHVYVCECKCVWMCEDLRLTLEIFLNHSAPYILGQGLLFQPRAYRFTLAHQLALEIPCPSA